MIAIGVAIIAAVAWFFFKPKDQAPQYISAEVSKGVAHVALDSEIPVIFGVLTTNNIEEAIERAGTKAGNKGFEAAMSAIEMVNLIKQIEN